MTAPRVVLTFSRGRFEGLARELSKAGYQVRHQPLIRTEPCTDAHSKAQARSLLNCDWLLFSSRSAVEAWLSLGLPLKSIRPQLGAVGPKTAKAIYQASGHLSLVAQPSHAEGLAKCFLNKATGGLVGLPQGSRALSTLEDRLRAAGIEVKTAIIYKTVLQPWPDVPADLILLASPSACQALASQPKAQLVTVGPSTSRAAQDRGWTVTEAAGSEISAIYQTIQEVLKHAYSTP